MKTFSICLILSAVQAIKLQQDATTGGDPNMPPPSTTDGGDMPPPPPPSTTDAGDQEWSCMDWAVQALFMSAD